MATMEYKIAEARRFANQLKAVEDAPLADRRESQIEFKNELESNLAHFDTTIRCIIAGHYGYGAQFYYKQITPRMNKRAWLFATAAALEYNVPNKLARQVWKKLPPELQAAIDTVIDEAILSSSLEN